MVRAGWKAGLRQEEAEYGPRQAGGGSWPGSDSINTPTPQLGARQTETGVHVGGGKWPVVDIQGLCLQSRRCSGMLGLQYPQWVVHLAPGGLGLEIVPF